MPMHANEAQPAQLTRCIRTQGGAGHSAQRMGRAPANRGIVSGAGNAARLATGDKAPWARPDRRLGLTWAGRTLAALPSSEKGAHMNHTFETSAAGEVET